MEFDFLPKTVWPRSQCGWVCVRNSLWTFSTARTVYVAHSPSLTCRPHYGCRQKISTLTWHCCEPDGFSLVVGLVSSTAMITAWFTDRNHTLIFLHLKCPWIRSFDHLQYSVAQYRFALFHHAGPAWQVGDKLGCNSFHVDFLKQIAFACHMRHIYNFSYVRDCFCCLSW